MIRYTAFPLALLAALGCNAYATGTPPAAKRPAATPVANARARVDGQRVTELATIEVKAPAAPADRDSALAAYGNLAPHATPAAITVIGHEQIADSQIRDLADLANLDAALGDGYAPIGYIQNLTIRGYPLDLATGYRINNLTVTGEQFIAFEEMQRIEILQGLAGLDAGVMEPGGVINFVTKRPADVHTLGVGTDSEGSRYAALDVGKWLTPSFGVRANLVSEAMHAFVDHAHGHRHLFSVAADWRISPHITLQLDADYEGYAQRSVSAYQLLGGEALPRHVDRRQMLAWEPWQQPTTIRAGNSSARLEFALAPAWTARLAVGHSRSVVQDNAAFAYGCGNSPGCNAGPTPAAWFAPNGNYDVWDYRSPNETYVDDQARATLDGRLGDGTVYQDLSVGAGVLHHTVALPDEVFDYVGSANIAEITPPFYPPSPAQPGAVRPRLDDWQRTLFALDRVHLGAHWQVMAGGRFVRLDQRAWNADGTPAPATHMDRFLPQVALLWTPTPTLTTYASDSKGLSLGAQAPYWTSNAGDTLAPRLTRQVQIGVKYLWRPRLDLEAAVYRIHQPYQFAEPDGADGFLFVQRGQEVHTGLELSANGQVTNDFVVHASLGWIRARAQGTGVAAYEGHQVMNVPRLRTTLSVDYRLPALPQLTVLAGWRYASPNPATADGRVRAPAYNVFDAGLRYTTTWSGHDVIWRLAIDNLFNRFYWRFTGSDGNDSYLLPGAPRLARLTVEVNL